MIEEEILKKRDEIPANETVTWEVVYSEGIPSMQLNWQLEDGEKGTYLIQYDGKDGLNKEEQKVFPRD